MDKKKDQRLTVLIHEHEHMIAVQLQLAIEHFQNYLKDRKAEERSRQIKKQIMS